MISLLKDGTFASFVLLPLGVVTLILMAGGMGVLMLLVWVLRHNLIDAFTPEFVQIVVLGLFALVGFSVVLACGTAYMIARLPRNHNVITTAEKQMIDADVRYLPANADTVRKNIEEFIG